MAKFTVKWQVVANFDGRLVESGSRTFVLIDKRRSVKDFVRDTRKFLLSVWPRAAYELNVNWIVEQGGN
jgi:hypothetical protein